MGSSVFFAWMAGEYSKDWLTKLRTMSQQVRNMFSARRFLAKDFSRTPATPKDVQKSGNYDEDFWVVWWKKARQTWIWMDSRLQQVRRSHHQLQKWLHPSAFHPDNYTTPRHFTLNSSLSIVLFAKKLNDFSFESSLFQQSKSKLEIYTS